MGRPLTGHIRNAVADRIIEILGERKLTCKELADALDMPPKATYGHLTYMYRVLGIVAPSGETEAKRRYGKALLWAKCEASEQPGRHFGYHRTITANWPRGEHKRDEWDVALFGERRKPEPVVVVDPRQMDLLEGI